MTNRDERSTRFSSISKADLLANQPENHYTNDAAVVGLAGSVSLIVGTMIGSGIFALAGGVFSQVGSVGLSLMDWGGCDMISMLGALCCAELGTMISKTVGEFACLLGAFGGPGAFLYSCTSVIHCSGRHRRPSLA